MSELAARLDEAFGALGEIGAAPGGGYHRFAWTAEDAALRRWFAGEAAARRMPLETDRNGNIWAWWPAPGDEAVATGSHLDSVPGGGGFDGPLGVVSAFLAVDLLAARRAAERHAAVATVGKLSLLPGAGNAVAATVEAWRDARAGDEESLEAVVVEVVGRR